MAAVPHDCQRKLHGTGKRHGFTNLRDWLSEVLFGQEQGPRMGSFIVRYGVRETATLMHKALKGELVAARGCNAAAIRWRICGEASPEDGSCFTQPRRQLDVVPEAPME